MIGLHWLYISGFKLNYFCKVHWWRSSVVRGPDLITKFFYLFLLFGYMCVIVICIWWSETFKFNKIFQQKQSWSVWGQIFFSHTFIYFFLSPKWSLMTYCWLLAYYNCNLINFLSQTAASPFTVLYTLLTLLQGMK